MVIDPYRSLTAEKGTDHLAVRPGTDAALALAMMHVIIDEDRHDADYVARHTVGFEALRERVQDYPPARAADICGIAGDDIVALARDYATTRPSAIRVNYGLQRHEGGGAAVRAITCLPALVGAWRDPAGGVLLSTGDFYGMNTAALERQDLLAGRRPRTINTSSIGDALLEATPPIRALERLQLQSGHRRARFGKSRARLRADRPLHRRPRRLLHRYRRLRRHLPPRPRRSSSRPRDVHKSVRAPVRVAQPAGHRPGGRGPAEYRGIPAVGPGHGPAPSRRSSKTTRR